MRTEAEPATRADIEEFLGESLPMTVRAWAWRVDGEVMAVAGYYMHGMTAVVFSELKPGAPKLAIWRESRKFMEKIKLPAICGTTPESRPFLERLGWKFSHMDGEKEVLTWKF